jgi:hypothetical protein
LHLGHSKTYPSWVFHNIPSNILLIKLPYPLLCAIAFLRPYKIFGSGEALDLHIKPILGS